MDEYVVMYINDKPIHSQSASDHARDLGRVLEMPRKNKFYVNAENSAFSLRKLEFLGHVLSCKNIRHDTKKIQVLREWEALQT